MDTQKIVEEIDTLLAEYSRAENASQYDDLSGGLSNKELYLIGTRLRAGIERLTPVGSTYRESLKDVTGHEGAKIVQYAGILGAIKLDYQAGYFRGIEELVHADLFDSFLEMAVELLSKNYKDPAAVVAGSVLELHIRKLAEQALISITDDEGKPKTFDALSIELVKKQVFPELQRKNISSWYSTRTEAAHGNFGYVIKEDVERMIEGIMGFLIRYPA